MPDNKAMLAEVKKRQELHAMSRFAARLISQYQTEKNRAPGASRAVFAYEETQMSQATKKTKSKKLSTKKLLRLAVEHVEFAPHHSQAASALVIARTLLKLSTTARELRLEELPEEELLAELRRRNPEAGFDVSR